MGLRFMRTDTSIDFLKRFNTLTHLLKNFESVAFNRGKRFINDKDICLPAVFVDTNHGKCIDTRRSITGFILYLGMFVISWQSKQQWKQQVRLYKKQYGLGDCLENSDAYSQGQLPY